ncbi:uncharacterized protein DDB_G0286299-like [Clytia hemisphaerica]|uniref:Uncharacterized protein n=1 Tax=Clytia hemisphaerica TaxID=252671 RepID=A0A7M5X9B9_9CNID
MTYSTDEDDSSESESESDNSDSDSNKGKKKKQKKTKKNEKSTKGKGEEKEQKSRKLSKNEMKNMFGDDQDTSESESGSEDEGDLHARLLASMEKDVIPEESEEDLITSRKPKDNDIAKTPAPAKAEEKPTKKENPKQKPPETITNEVKPKVPVTEKPKPKQSEKPAPKTKVEKKDSLKTPSQETTQNKNYQNGPVVDFHEQIRKISTAHGPQAPDLSQLDIPEKHRTSSQNEDDIHNTIDDILKEEPKTGSKSRRGSAKRPISATNSATNAMAEGPENEEEKMKALEEHILENHGKHKQKDEMKKKGSEIDDLISELNLDT